MERMQRIVAITFVGHFVNDGLMLMLPLLIPFIARDFALSYTQIGFLGGSLMLTTGLGQIFTGYLSDFSKVKWPFILLGLAILSLSLFAMSFSPSYGYLIAFNLLAGLGASFYHPCGVSLLVKHMKDRIKGKILGIHGVGGCIGILVYPLVAGIILTRWEWREVLLILAPTGLVAAALLILTGEEKSSHSGRRKYNLFNRESLFLAALLGCIAMFYRGLVTFLPVQLEEMGLTAPVVAAVVTTFYGTGVLGEFSAGFLSDRYSKQKIVFVSLLAASLLAVVLFKSVWVFIFPLGFVSYVVWVPITAIYVEGVPEAWYGTALGLFQGVAGLMAFIGPIAMGAIAERSTIHSSFFFLCGVALVGAFISLKINRPINR